MKKQNKFFDGFESVSNMIGPELDSDDLNRDPEPNPDVKELDPDELKKDVENKDIDNDDIDDSTKDNDLDNVDDDKKVSDSSKDDDKSIDNDTDDLGEHEKDITLYVQDKLFDKLGWEKTEDDKFETVSDLVDYLEQVVKESSTPAYPSEEVEKLAKFVEDGGDVRDFYDKVYRGIDTKSIDIDKVSDQRAVTYEMLKLKGYSEDSIKKRISRYEDTEILKEEAEEALEFLDQYKKESEKKLLEDQENYRKSIILEQQKFVSNVEKTISEISDIKGISLSKDKKKQLRDYILKVEADGTTRYQKDYAKSSKNLIESAYFTMEGDALLSKIAAKASTASAKSLKEKLSISKAKINRSSEADDYDSSKSDVWSIASNFLRN